MSYSLLHVLPLLGAIAFIGTLFFEVIILAKVKPQLAPGALTTLEQALGRRPRTVLHWVVLLVYGAGFGLAWYHRQALADPFASSFATLLSLKILLAVSLFFSLGLVAILLRSGRRSRSLYRKLHWAVLAQMLGIVLLAKGMFYIQW